LDRVLKVLESSKFGTFQIGFLEPEGAGVYRIAQSGVPSAKESRLYVYFDTGSCVVFVLGIGTKETQDADIREAKALVKKIKET
jgi:putative component of toxin-antitoxin plasmid stabilization module